MSEPKDMGLFLKCSAVTTGFIVGVVVIAWLLDCV